MLKPWHFSTKNRKVFFTGDTHFNHNPKWPVPIWKMRGYNSVQEMDSGIIKIWNERVALEDDVIHVGDFVFQANSEITKQYINRLNGYIYYIWGNHNSGTKQLYQELLEDFYVRLTGVSTKKLFFDSEGNGSIPEVYPLTWGNKFTFVGNYMFGKVDHIEFTATHFAQRIWDHMGHACVAISGHSHGSDKESNPDWKEGKRLDVGIENFKGPVNFDEILTIFNSKKIIKLDHHDEHTTSSSF